jgi:formylglycine-generating enzyme required for sulfatase activity
MSHLCCPGRWTIAISFASILSLPLAATSHGQCSPADINGDGVVDGIDLSLFLQDWSLSCPAVIETVSPALGLPSGGTTITIKGAQLGGVLSVAIGGVPATNVVGVDPMTVIAVTPPSKSLGSKDVSVTTTAGTVTLVGGFVYASEWATVIEALPDPAVVTDESLRAAIVATGLPWRVRDNASQIEMLLVPPGEFMMGCSASQDYGCDDDENPVHQVVLTQAFYLGRYEVTQAEWSAVMGSNPSNFQGQPDSPSRPVEMISWQMIQGFEAATGLRLPTEAEWEYACRAGTTTAFNNGSNDDSTLPTLAWFEDTSDFQTRPVGQKLANALGLHDMHGNVWEWLEDWFGAGYYAKSPAIDPPGPSSGTSRVLRGGSWSGSSDRCRSSNRSVNNPDSFRDNVGIRVARTP